MAMDRLEEAEPLLEEVLVGRPECTAVASNLAVLRGMKGDYARAEPLLRGVLQERQRCQGPSHEDTLQAMNNLAWCLHHQEKPEAAEWYNACLAGCKKALGTKHKLTLECQMNLGEYHSSRCTFQMWIGELTSG